MGQILSTGWSIEHSEALRGFVASGFSYAQSAAKINAQFGTSYSRNSAIGRANRIGLACPKRSPQPKQKRIHKPRLRIVSACGNSTAQRVIQVSQTELAALRCAEVLPRNLSLMDLEPNDCRYPYGDGPITFCALPKLDGSSYCPGHFALTKDHRMSNESRVKARQKWYRENGLGARVFA